MAVLTHVQIPRVLSPCGWAPNLGYGELWLARDERRCWWIACAIGLTTGAVCNSQPERLQYLDLGARCTGAAQLRRIECTWPCDVHSPHPWNQGWTSGHSRATWPWFANCSWCCRLGPPWGFVSLQLGSLWLGWTACSHLQ